FVTPVEHNRRLILLGLAIVVGPTVSIIGDTDSAAGAIFVAFCSMLLGLGVIARFVNLIHENLRAQEATAISERRFRLMADSAPVGIFELGRSMRITYANSEGNGMLGPAIVGLGPSDVLARVDPDSREELEHAIAELTDGRPGKADVKLVGEPDRWVAWSGVPVTAPELHLPTAFASTLDITSLKLAEAALARQATHDPLTGLPNRRFLLEALIRALHMLGRGNRTGTVALMFVDLDQFKMVNDVLGHDAGDELLKTASARLRGAVRAHDTVARFGGDEFVVLLEHVTDRVELHDVAQRILDALQVPIAVAGTEAQVGASVGIATARGPDDDPDALLRNADSAMYRAKEHGRGCYEFFRHDSDGQSHRML
ncbi:MAG: sensor domain-containing diguanylate cyclase, partial [Acidimicrobiia bacterium]